MTRKESRDRVLMSLMKSGIKDPRPIKDSCIVALQYPMICNVNLDFVKAGGGSVDACVYAFGAGMSMVGKLKECFDKWMPKFVTSKWWGANVDNASKRSCVVVKFRTGVMWNDVSEADCKRLRDLVFELASRIDGLGLKAETRVRPEREIRQVDENGLNSMVAALEPVRNESNRFNLFAVLNISRMEIRHSNMLAWLLDANEKHGFGGALAKDLLRATGVEDQYDFSSFQVLREWHNIDILLVSRSLKVLVAIENKVGAHEGVRKTKNIDCEESQLVTYCNELDRFYEGFKKHLIFLTPDGQPPSDTRWQMVTYEDVLKSLRNHFNGVYGVTSTDCEFLDKKVLIKNYIETIERDVLMKINNELKEKCRQIYNAHRDEIEFVLQYGKLNYAEEAEQVLKEDNFKALGVESTGGVNFRLKVLDKIFPVQDVPVSWWGNSPYTCYLVIDDDGRRVCCCMAIAPVSNPEVKKAEDRLLFLLGDKEWKVGAKWMVVPWRSRGGKVNLNNWHSFGDEGTGQGCSFSEAMTQAVDEFVKWAQGVSGS